VAQPDCPPPTFPPRDCRRGPRSPANPMSNSLCLPPPPTVTLLEAGLAPFHCPEMSVRPPLALPVTAAVTAAVDFAPPAMPGAFFFGCPRPP